MKTGLQNIDGKTYYFYNDGKMAINTVIDGYIVVDGNGVVVSNQAAM